MSHESIRNRRASLLALLLGLAPHALSAQSATATYEYEYPYNTPDLIENHFIVLDSLSGEWRGWYYATSDEFDQAREGYLPGFFVAPMTELEITGTTITFALERPDRFFTGPVPREYRDASDVPAGLLEPWTMPLPIESVRYTGTRRDGEIVLSVVGGDRVFRPAANPR